MTRLPQAAAVMAIATAALAACGSAPQSASNADDTGAPMVFSSSREPHAIAACLRGRISRIDERTGPGYVELGVGRSSSGYGWLITLTPLPAGSNVRVEKAVENDSVSEPALRYAIARCVM
jgi:hypothetical protein